MIVLLEDEIFNSSRTVHLDLLSVFGLGREGRHRLQTDPLYNSMASSAINTWLNRLDQQTREEAVLALEIGLEQDVLGTPSEVSIRVADLATPDWNTTPPRLPLPYALRLLQRPLSLLVENRHNDGAFLQAVIPTPWREHLLRSLEKGWIDFDHGGGTDMKTRVRTAKFEEALRLWALFDSDAREPGKPSPSSEELRHACVLRRIPHHRLSRRAIENYLPVKALEAWVHISPRNSREGRRRSVAGFASMQPEQRHHYHMKKGFEADRKSGVPDLFDSHSNRPELQRGFGDEITSLFHQLNFPIREEWLLKDGQRGEAISMAQAIFRRL